MKNEAVAFVRAFAEEHYTYTGDEVLAAYRDEGGSLEDAGRGYRLNWGNVMLCAERQGIHKTIGRVKPREPHSHIASTCLRQSRVFIGEPPETENPKEFLRQIYSAFAQRKITAKEAIYMAYTYGVEDAYTDCK